MTILSNEHPGRTRTKTVVEFNDNMTCVSRIISSKVYRMEFPKDLTVSAVAKLSVLTDEDFKMLSSIVIDE